MNTDAVSKKKTKVADIDQKIKKKSKTVGEETQTRFAEYLAQNGLILEG